MAELLSAAFQSDALLNKIADDLDRISRTQHNTGNAVRSIQAALLLWKPGYVYAVYLNLPDGATAEDRTLQNAGRWDPTSLKVTLEPTPPPAPPGQRAMAPDEVSHEPIRIGRIALFVDQ
jgi:hypothetical protein